MSKNTCTIGSVVYLQPGSLFKELKKQFGEKIYRGIIHDIENGIAIVSLDEGGYYSASKSCYLMVEVPIDDLFTSLGSIREFGNGGNKK